MDWMAIFGVLKGISLDRITLSTRITRTGYTKKMKDIPTLLEAILDCYDDPKLSPSNGETFCNVAAQRICHAYGCIDFRNKTADEIFDFLISSPIDWSSVPIEKVQEMANQGTMVFAVASSKMLDQDHGHIAVVRPGIPCYSGKWGLSPRIMNIGSENFIARAKKGPLVGMAAGVNEAFQPLPKFFAWRPSL